MLKSITELPRYREIRDAYEHCAKLIKSGTILFMTLPSNRLTNRITKYNNISNLLRAYSDEALEQLLKNATSLGTSIGGDSILLTIDDTPVFIKKIRLTDIEKKPENVRSTRNLFNLPLYYQYGVGSTGFGAWRELLAHEMTTDWVLTGACMNFPLLYHSRILDADKKPQTADELAKLEKDVTYWDGSSAIRNRLLANLQSATDIVLFLEYFPYNLQTWLKTQILTDANTANSACIMVDNQLKEIMHFINSHGLLHFDAHFWNILTDGKQLYLSDFGLAVSSKFDLSPDEKAFFNLHSRYDIYSSVTNLLYCIITSKFGEDDWKFFENNWITALKKYCQSNANTFSGNMDAVIKKYAPIALVMDQFYRSLQSQSKKTPYPRNELDQLYNRI